MAVVKWYNPKQDGLYFILSTMQLFCAHTNPCNPLRSALIDFPPVNSDANLTFLVIVISRQSTQDTKCQTWGAKHAEASEEISDLSQQQKLVRWEAAKGCNLFISWLSLLFTCSIKAAKGQVLGSPWATLCCITSILSDSFGHQHISCPVLLLAASQRLLKPMQVFISHQRQSL